RKVTKRKGARLPRSYGSAAMLGKTGRPETRCAQTVRPADRFFLRFSLVSKRDTKRVRYSSLELLVVGWGHAPP
ncbi:MAG: hypothetical protein ABW160_19745, partial [Candidatus Thiodiazotropha sp. 4PDIV1]